MSVRDHIIEAYEKAQSPRALVLLQAALSAHEYCDQGDQPGQSAEQVDDPSGLSGHLVSNSHENDTQAEEQ